MSCLDNNEFQVTYPKPEIAVEAEFGAKVQRTMRLLAESTKENPNTVKMLFYGQSITKQDWTREVARYLKSSFPYANLIIKNLAIGGFDAKKLVRTYEQDVYPFYPDLVIFHVYGDEEKYEEIIAGIRKNTIAEILIHSDHLRVPTAEDIEYQDWRSRFWMPQLAEKYHCEFVKVREPWKEYLEANNLKADDLLVDGCHLNKYGDFLMAELIKPHLRHIKGRSKELTEDVVAIYELGKDINFENGKLVLPFEGNKVDLIISNEGEFSAEVFIDGKKPSEFKDCYTISRPNDYPDRTWAADGKDWPWEMGAVTRVTLNVTPLIEEWTMKFIEVSENVSFFKFEVFGSVTGFDGTGNSREKFLSNSGRVIIEPQDWFIKEAHDFAFAVPISVGYEVKWQVKAMFFDEISIYEKLGSREQAITLIQGLENKVHLLELIAENNYKDSLKYIKVFIPRTRQQ
jgi:hypothetical protein